jgi:hypothetical protein
VRHDGAHLAAHEALFVQHEGAVRFDDRVEAIEHGRAAEVGVVEHDPVALLHAAHEHRVVPAELAGRVLHLLEAAKQVDRVASRTHRHHAQCVARESGGQLKHARLAAARRPDQHAELVALRAQQRGEKGRGLAGQHEQRSIRRHAGACRQRR